MGEGKSKQFTIMKWQCMTKEIHDSQCESVQDRACSHFTITSLQPCARIPRTAATPSTFPSQQYATNIEDIITIKLPVRRVCSEGKLLLFMVFALASEHWSTKVTHEQHHHHHHHRRNRAFVCTINV
jgi:hypothetical protein